MRTIQDAALNRLRTLIGVNVAAHPLWFIFGVSFAMRVLWVVASHPDPYNMVDSTEYHEMATALLDGKGLITWIGFVRPPLYPIFVAMCYAVGGIVALQLAQAALGGAASALIAVLSRRLGADSIGLWCAGLAAAFYPWFFQFVGGLASENLFTPVAILAFVLIIDAADRVSARRALLAGISFGLATLARTNLLVLSPFLAAWWFRSSSRLRAGLFWLGILASLAPFIAYNVAQGNGLVIGSSGGGLSFFIGNNPDMALLYSGKLSDGEWLEQNRIAGSGDGALAFAGCTRPSRTEELCAEKATVAQREAFFYQTGLRYIRMHPGEWAGTLGQKLMHYWRPWVEPRAYSRPVVLASGISFSTILFLAVIGLTRMPRRHAAFVLLVAVASSLSVMLYMVQLRYRYALLDPVLIASAGVGASWLILRLRKRSLIRRASG